MPKQDPGVELQGSEYYTAASRWYMFWGQNVPGITFSNFLGMSHFATPLHSSGAQTVMVRQSAARKIRMLNGPHWHALLKAYQVRKSKAE